MKVQSVPITQIIAGGNDRKVFDPQALKELADSITKHGLKQPISLRIIGWGHIDGSLAMYREGIEPWLYNPDLPAPDTLAPLQESPEGMKPLYEVMAGERRLRAAKLSGLTSIPSLVHPDASDEVALDVMLLENIQRQDLNPIEEAQAYQRRVDFYKENHPDADPLRLLVTRTGKSRRHIVGRLSLLKLPLSMQTFVATGKIPLEAAELIAREPGDIMEAAIKVYARSQRALTTGEVKDLILALREQSESTVQLFSFAEAIGAAIAGADGVKRGACGPNAVIPRIKAEGIPPCRADPTLSIGTFVSRYMLTLEENGLHSEAAAVGELYRALVVAGKARVATNAIEKARYGMSD